MDPVPMKTMPVGSKLSDLLDKLSLESLLKRFLPADLVTAFEKVEALLASGQFPDLSDGHTAGTLFVSVEAVLAGVKDHLGLPVLGKADTWMLGAIAAIKGEPAVADNGGAILFGLNVADIGTQVVLPANPTEADIRHAVGERVAKMKFAFPAFLIPILIDLVVAWIKRRQSGA